jgi:hypothetical protein
MKVASGLYLNVTGSPAYTQLMPASCQPPTSSSISGDAFEAQRCPCPNGSDHTKLVVLL